MAQKALNLEDIVAGNVIQTKGIGSMTWLKDGERYSCLENNKQTGGMEARRNTFPILLSL